MLATIRDALALVGRSRRRKFSVVGLLAVVVSAIEALAAVFVLVLMGLVLDPGPIPDVSLLGDLDQYFASASYDDLVLGFAIVFGLFMVLRSAAILVEQYVLSRVAENTGVLLTDRLFEGYLSMPYEFHLGRNSAELIRNAYGNVQQIVGSVFTPLATALAETVLVMVAVLVAASPLATLAVTVLMLGVVAVTFAVVEPRLKRLSRARQEGARSAMRYLQQGPGGLRDVKILGREEAFAGSSRRSRAVMARSGYLRSVLAYVPRVSIELAFIGFVLAALVGAAFGKRLESILAAVGLFAYAGMRLQPSLQRIPTSLNNLRYAQAAVGDLKADMGHLDSSVSERRSAEADAEDTTWVMVAHRLSSNRDCDRIIFVRDSRVSGIGTYEHLRATNDAFRAMAA